MAGNILATSGMLTRGLGTVSPVPMGDWNASTEYLKLNTVRSHNATYQAKKNNRGVEPTVTQGWQEVWQVVAYDGLVAPVGNYPEMTVGQAINDGEGNNIAQSLAGKAGTAVATKTSNGLMSAEDKTKLDELGGGGGVAPTTTVDGVALDRENVVHYGICETAYSVQDKVATVQGTFSLVEGARVSIFFSDYNDLFNTTLNVNGTGAIRIYYRRGYSEKISWLDSSIIDFRYDGTFWIITTAGNCNHASSAGTLGTLSFGSQYQPIYLFNGSPIQCKTYVNKVSNNGVILTNSGTQTKFAIQQGQQAIAQDGTATITFPQAFADTNYSIVVMQGKIDQADSNMNSFRIEEKTASTCTIKTMALANTFEWIAAGKIPN